MQTDMTVSVTKHLFIISRLLGTPSTTQRSESYSSARAAATFMDISAIMKPTA